MTATPSPDRQGSAETVAAARPAGLAVEAEIEAVVAGGGVVGLAIAAALADAGHEVLLIEAGPRCGDETSGRNNQVLHAGFLYPPGSLKARLCRPGQARLLAYARDRGLPHRVVPKLIPVPDAAGRVALDRLREQGRACGVGGLGLLDRAALARLEPELRAEAALLSEATAIIDAPALTAALEADLQAAGGMVLHRYRVLSGETPAPGATWLRIDGPEGESTLACRLFVNAAGLGAVALVRAMAGFPAEAIPAIHLARGQFLSHRGATPFAHLVVPLEPALSAGGSLTVDMGGQARFGPDLSFLQGPDYRPDDRVSPTAIEAIAAWWPGLDPARLAVDFVGIRPRVTGPGEPPGDWQIAGPDRHGLAGQFHLFGIDTPGLTACLALADHLLAIAGTARHHKRKALP